MRPANATVNGSQACLGLSGGAAKTIELAEREG
jgi:hypothetical protein